MDRTVQRPRKTLRYLQRVRATTKRGGRQQSRTVQRPRKTLRQLQSLRATTKRGVRQQSRTVQRHRNTPRHLQRVRAPLEGRVAFPPREKARRTRSLASRFFFPPYVRPAIYTIYANIV